MKIVITGGLGYIGTEVCRILSGLSRAHEIIVIDNRFLHERVHQLFAWGIKYVQASLFDEDVLRANMNDANVVIHLAGITDVAYVKTESNSAKDKEIRDVAVIGTNNVIRSIGDDTSLIFPSTHVVFEGLNECKLNLDEGESVAPRLAYAESKVANEEAIRLNHKKHVILRLGSVYGLSEDSMRIGIMPNLFSKKSALGEPIRLFGRGVQYKSLIHVIDVARAIVFFSFNVSFYGSTFHLSNENVTVKDVAYMCKDINPSTIIQETDDLIPNAGYTLSNQKLLSTGFRFIFNLKDSLKEMIQYWSFNPAKLPEETVSSGQNTFADDRGFISNYPLPEAVNLIGVIFSKAGSVRANHIHPVQQQKCILISGSYISITKDVAVNGVNAPLSFRLISAGEMSVIPPNVAHAMLFLEDSMFLNLVAGERDHDKYGVTHTYPYKLIDCSDKRLAEFLTEHFKR